MNFSDDEIVQKALEILKSRMRQSIVTASSPKAVTDFLIMSLAHEEREVFGVLWMDVKNKVLANEHLFFGTLTYATVYPREVVKAALKVNAAAAVVYHNHPSSGDPAPSNADLKLTDKLKEALEMVDVRLLDHVIVAGVQSYSLAEHGQI